MKIAIIEDDLIIQMFLENVAYNSKLEVVGTATCFKDAIRLIKNTKPDLIILDIGLKGSMDGIETAKIITNRFSIPHIFISGNSDKMTQKRAKATNPLGFINKPIDEETLKNNLLDFKEKIKIVS